jgi:hypothetical protein
MGVTRDAIWLEQAVSGALGAAEIRYEGYMGVKFVAAGDN